MVTGGKGRDCDARDRAELEVGEVTVELGLAARVEVWGVEADSDTCDRAKLEVGAVTVELELVKAELWDLKADPPAKQRFS